MRAAIVAIVLLVLAACGSPAAGPSAERSLVLATTTSTQDSGLLDDLLPAFTAATGWAVKPVAVGSGQAIEMGRRGEADVLLVHSPAAEEDYVAEGTAGRRLLVMHNDFVLLGPEADPAGVRGATVSEAMRRIAAAGAVFVSRGDDSGTHAREKSLWEKAGVAPGAPWYQETGQGMGATLRVAAEKAGYTLSDRSTYLTQPGGLALLVEGDPGLFNVYHVIEVTKRAGERVQPEAAAAFADWITGPDAQRRIGEFGREEYGQPLFVPDAGEPDPTGP
ncbi:substrate-binding domain-containing protein [Pseudonocardia cypriaca]|uniref:Tungstate transport system substrate-binding protein n=1 Tax=Pseudonocardia cypriaca TaxID=882449 RepID=A0A543FU54_9PSEU|nr:substrate-binding domain-containing protein [Pseudonocardia cypriaca]TQM37365.1 tungstate transport system substrate-binding protein [Pseudonocardia cypriaca]